MAGYFLLAGCGALVSKNPLRAREGVLDLSQWNFEKEGAVELSGEYEFYWQQLLAPENFAHSHPPQKSGFIPVPGSWQNYELNGEKFPGEGFATYRLMILLNDSLPQKLAFKFLDMGTAFSVFANGKNILSTGRVGQNRESSAPKYAPQVVEFFPQASRIELIYHVSNFHYRRGGAWEVIHLGTAAQLQHIRERRLALDLILFGSILIMGLYHLKLYGLSKNELSFLFFGMYCLLIAVRLLTTVERYLLHLFSELNWELFVKIEFFSFYPAVPVLALFLYKLFPDDFHKPAVAAIVGAGLLFSSLIILTPARIYTRTLAAFHWYMIACIVYGLSMLALFAVRKREGAAIILAGFLFLCAAVVNDILDASGFLQTGHYVHLGLFVFIFSHALMLSSRYAKAFTTIASQRSDLGKANATLQSEIGEHKHTKERYRALYEDNPSMYFTVDNAGTVLSVNHFGAEQLGYTVAELVGQPVLNVFYEEDRPGVLQQLETCLQHPQQVYHWEFRKVRKNGSWLWVKEHGRAVPDRRGHAVVLIVCEDIDEQKQAEAALRESEKFAATGRMAARIAHEINNPLGAIKNSFRLVSRAVPQEHRHHHYVEKIDYEIDRIAGIVHQMLELYRPAQNVAHEFHLGRCLEDVVALMGLASSTREVEITLEAKRAAVLVRLPENHIRQIMFNLLQNAIEASPPGETVRVTARCETQQLIITVADRGLGIPEELRSRIFEPFFTTKSQLTTGGIGLGLSICKSLVDSMNGAITFASQAGQETVFQISIPLVDNAIPEENHASFGQNFSR